MYLVHFYPARWQSAQQMFYVGMPACIRRKQLDEPAIVGQLFQPGLSRFQALRGERAKFVRRSLRWVYRDFALFGWR